MKIRWERSEDGYVISHCGHWKITPLFWGCVKPQWFELHRDGRRVASMMSSQREAKARAEELVTAPDSERTADAAARLGRAIYGRAPTEAEWAAAADRGAARRRPKCSKCGSEMHTLRSCTVSEDLS